MTGDDRITWFSAERRISGICAGLWNWVTTSQLTALFTTRDGSLASDMRIGDWARP